MWQKLKEQIPTILITAILIVAAAYWLHRRTLTEMSIAQQKELDPLREQNEALKTATEENQHQISAVNQLLKDAIAKHQTDLFMSDEETAKLNARKIDTLADAIAHKLQPFNPVPQTPEEAAKLQNEQVDKVSARLAVNIKPILEEMSHDQHLTRESIAQYNQRISDQIGIVLTSELAKNQQLNLDLQQTQTAAQDALKLAHETTALYLSTLKDQGLLTRLLTLPANVVKDIAHFNIVDKRDQKQIAGDLINKMNDIDQRLKTIQASEPAADTAAAAAPADNPPPPAATADPAAAPTPTAPVAPTRPPSA